MSAVIGDSAQVANHYFAIGAIAAATNLIFAASVIFTENRTGDHQLRFDVADVNEHVMSQHARSNVLILAGRAVELVTIATHPFHLVAFTLGTVLQRKRFSVHFHQLACTKVVFDFIYC